jgi:hypothetical protein
MSGNVELDHFFICTAAGAPEAERLIELGLTEGAPNTHPGQGTACRRFFFENAFLELVWVTDAAEAQSPAARGCGSGGVPAATVHHRLAFACESQRGKAGPRHLLPGSIGPRTCPTRW